jgi:uroporphyrinogen decarboxylase
MTPRERMLLALNHQEPDRVPIDLGAMNTTIEAEAYESLKRYLGMDHPTLVSTRAHAVPHEDVARKFGIDTRYVYPYPLKEWDPDTSESRYDDEWGVTWEKQPGTLYFEVVRNPLADASLADLHHYPWPKAKDFQWNPTMAEDARRLFNETDYAVVGNALDMGLFERAWLLRGFEQLLVDLMVDEKFACTLLDKVLEAKIDHMAHYLDAVGDHIHVIMLGDDIAMQTGPIFSMDVYRRIFKPRHKELHDFIKSRTNAKIFFHCCGSVYPILNDLIETGIDIINPIQVSAANMDTKNLKAEFGDRVVFWGGGCDTQKVLQFGTPAEVREEVRRRIHDLAPGGGFVFNQVHCIQPNVQPENICAMYEAVEEFGQYPIG